MYYVKSFLFSLKNNPVKLKVNWKLFTETRKKSELFFYLTWRRGCRRKTVRQDACIFSNNFHFNSIHFLLKLFCLLKLLLFSLNVVTCKNTSYTKNPTPKQAEELLFIFSLFQTKNFCIVIIILLLPFFLFRCDPPSHHA